MRVGLRAAPFVLLTSLVSGLGVASAHGSPAEPDLVVSSVAVTGTPVVPGGQLAVTYRTVNKGAAAVGASKAAFYLGTTPQHRGADVPLGVRSVRKLKAGAGSQGAATVTVPAGTAPGSYWLLVCADSKHKRAERKEGNNCGKAGLTVSSAPGPADVTPPTFGGLTSVGNVGACAVVGDPPCQAVLHWAAASDNVTASSNIVYDIYFSNTSGGQNFTTPSQTTPPGVTDYTVPTQVGVFGYWVVRARDLRGNRDANTVQMQTQPPP